MFAQTAAEKKTAKKFQPKFKSYLKTIGRDCCTVKMKRCPIAKKSTLSEVVNVPDRDITHVFEPEVMLAVSHAIEDLAGEVGQGELIATFQNLANFEHQRTRYANLARDLDAVRVWGSGEIPKHSPRIDFIVTDDPKIKRYWLVLFAGPEDHAVLVCKQINQAKVYGNKKFVGFYSFNPYLVQSIRWRFNLLTSGLHKLVTHWDHSLVMPDFKLRDLDVFLHSQQEKGQK